MCEIAGIIGRLDESNRAALQRMNQAMVHRGPDAGGMWFSTPDDRGWGALLGHRRLSKFFVRAPKDSLAAFPTLQWKLQKPWSRFERPRSRQVVYQLQYSILFSLQGCIDLLPAQTSGYSARNSCRRHKM
jgi:hypothetical protein